MKRIILLPFICVILICAWIGESRSFYCIDNSSYVTIWKTYNNICYVIPGRYYGLIKPSRVLLETTNTNNIDIFITKRLPKTLIFKEEGDAEGNSTIQLYNGYEEKNEYHFVNYDDNKRKWDSILYKRDAKRFNDLNNDANFFEIEIKENFAIDKNGKRL